MAYNNQEQHDYADSLEPGYRFCPTDVELIVYYLKPKIDTGRRHPKCRYYEVNIYDYDPDELTAKPEYRSCEKNKWYFLTPRERKYPNGTRSNRQTKSGGTWKSNQMGKPQRDDMNQVVGSKTCLFYLDEKGNKTDWLMHEYTTDNPNIPTGSQEQKEDSNKLTQWVLCKIYKKQKKRANNNDGDQEEAFEEQNQQLQYEPLPRRRRLSLNQESNQSNGPEHAQETNYHSNQQSDLNIVHVGASQIFPTTSMSTSPNSVTMQPMAMYCGSKLTQPAVQDPQAFAMDQVQQSVGKSTLVYYQNQSMPTSTNGFQFSCGASCSSSKGSPPAIVEQGDNDMVPGPHEEDIFDGRALLDYFLTFPAPSLAVQMDTSSNPIMTVQQMASSQTLRDEVLQQQVQNSYEDAMGYHPSEYHSSDFLDELDDL